jgi:hypothetical protein
MSDTTRTEPSTPDGGTPAPEAPAPEWMPLPDVALALAIDVMKVRQLVRERQLLAVRRDGILYVPSAFVCDGRVTKGLPGVLTLLGDARYTEEEMLDWLFRPDESLPGTPIEALRENRGTEVKRRAQALGF